MKYDNVFNVDMGPVLEAIFAPLHTAVGWSGRGETRMSQQIRIALREALVQMVRDAFADGAGPLRTGAARTYMENGVRAYGTSFLTIRAFVRGPIYIGALNTAATILPRNASRLAIPLSAACRADGSPKLPGPNSWRLIKTFVWKSKKTGQSYIVHKNADGTFLFLYILVDEIKLPTKWRGFLDRAWDKQKATLMERIGMIMMAEFVRFNFKKLARIA